MLQDWHELYNPERPRDWPWRISRRSEDSLDGEDLAPTDTKTGRSGGLFAELVYNPKCRVPYHDLTDTQDLETIANICSDAVENGRDEPLKLLVVRCATCDHVLVDEHRETSPQRWWRF